MKKRRLLPLGILALVVSAGVPATALATCDDDCITKLYACLDSGLSMNVCAVRFYSCVGLCDGTIVTSRSPEKQPPDALTEKLRQIALETSRESKRR